ncbi:MAG: hypothetical protein WCF85_15485 [Rhodospirillaceae bacterium]
MPDSIRIGERFRRPETTRLVYRVIRLVWFDHHLPHATLVSENPDRRWITIGTALLKDRRQWIPAEV